MIMGCAVVFWYLAFFFSTICLVSVLIRWALSWTKKLLAPVKVKKANSKARLAKSLFAIVFKFVCQLLDELAVKLNLFIRYSTITQQFDR